MLEPRPQVEPLVEQVSRAVSLLQAGGVVAYPTDTLYGLGAHAFCESAVERVFAIKGRPYGMPLPLLLADAAALYQVTPTVSPLVQRLVEQFWPGPLTLVVPAGELVSALVTARGWTVAVRVPDHPVPRELARRIGAPITGTSANRTGGAEPSSPADVVRQLGDAVDLVIRDDSPLLGRASTVLDTTGPVPRLLRLGAVSWGAILAACQSGETSRPDAL